MSLDDKFTKTREELDASRQHIINNTQDAVVFLEKHYETLLGYKEHSSRSQFRSHVLNLISNEYNGVVDLDVISRCLASKCVFSGGVYIAMALITSLICTSVLFFIDKNLTYIIGFCMIFMGTIFFGTLFEFAFFKSGKMVQNKGFEPPL